jgi:hypothetical protein
MKMAKYLNLWEVVPGTMPADPKERGAILGKMGEMTKKMMDDGLVLDWGVFSSGSAGYAISAGEPIDGLKAAMLFAPYYKFDIHPVLSLGEAMQAMQSLQQ